MLINGSRGFTLIELIVAMGLFAFVMSISMGAYLVMIATSREAQASATGINNLSYALESMSRDMRTGKSYSLSCGPGGSNTFSFDRYDQNGVVTRVVYTLSTGRIYQQEGSDTPYPLTDPLVQVGRLMFYCNGTQRGGGDVVQANVTVVIEGTVSAGPAKSRTFNVQTTSTMRGVDL